MSVVDTSAVTAPGAPVALADFARIAWSPVEIHRLEVLLLDEPIETPVRTSFGTMRSRPGLLVRVTDTQGVQGHGEVWSNFPEGAARYKATLACRVVAPLLEGRTLQSPDATWLDLSEQLAVLALQCADFGAIAQVLAGVDQALWDLFSRRADRPLWDIFGGRRAVPVYASGIGPGKVAETIHQQAKAGHVRFKIKLGFGDEVDTRNLRDARAALPEDMALMVDVNQGWSIEQSLRWMPRLAELGIVWCEEPMRADAPHEHGVALSAVAGAMRIAGGENLMGAAPFLAAAAQGGLGVLQPDLGKWGGFSGGLAMARDVAKAPHGHGVWVCPHWLAGGVGLLASLQFKSIVGGGGWAEVDVNPNPLRTQAFARALPLTNGDMLLPDSAGAIAELAPAFGDAAGWTRSA